MLDLQHLPSGGSRLDILLPTGGSTTADWQAVNRPRGAQFCYILAIGAGAGGGGGVSAATGNAGGGGGGGSGGLTRIWAPAILLPQTFYVLLGRGGAGSAGAAAPVAATAGGASYLALRPAIAQSILGLNGALVNGGGAGTAATTAAAGGAGSSGAAATLTAGSVFATLMGLADTGRPGVLGGATAAGTVVNPTGFITGGAGGAGAAATRAASSGGSVPDAFTSDGSTITIAGGTGSATTRNAAADGQHGISILPSVHNPYQLKFTGGAGGGNSNTDNAGNGGNGGYGCGGGGGGAATTGGTGGRGGDAVMFIWWF